MAVQNDNPLAVVHVEVGVGEQGIQIESRLEGKEAAVIMAVATAVQKMANKQHLSVSAAMYGLLGVIDLMEHTTTATIDMGAIQKAREGHGK